jgi:hypothetical protein
MLKVGKPQSIVQETTLYKREGGKPALADLFLPETYCDDDENDI